MQLKARSKHLNFIALQAALFLTISHLFVNDCISATKTTAGTTSTVKSAVQIRISSTPSTLDWNRSTTGSEGAILQNLMEGLMALNRDFTATPLLAEKMTISPDGRTYTFTLKKGILWTDGKELQAQHFADSFERLLNDKIGSKNASLLFVIQGAKEYHYGKIKSFKDAGVKILNPYEFTVELIEPFAPFPLIFTHWATFPIRKEFTPGEKSPTLGPFQFESKTADTWTLKKNPKWRLASKMPFSKAIFRVYVDGQKALEAFKNKKLDFLLQLEDDLLEKGKKLGGVLNFVEPTRVSILLLPNPNRQALNSPEKRRAFFKLIRTKELVSENPLTREAANTILPRSILKFAQSWHPKMPADDSSFQFPDEPLTIGYGRDDSLSKDIADKLAKYLKAKTEPIQSQVENVTNYSTMKRVDVYIKLYGLVFLDPDQLYSAFLYQGNNDLYGWSHPDFTRSVSKARQTVDNQERSKLYEKAEDILQNETAIAFPLFYRRRAYLLSPKIIELNDEPQGSALVRNLTLKIH